MPDFEKRFVRYNGQDMPVIHMRDVPVTEVLCNDFLDDPYYDKYGERLLMYKEQLHDGKVIVLWDHEGLGFTYNYKATVDILRPKKLDDGLRVWPDEDETQMWVEIITEDRNEEE